MFQSKDILPGILQMILWSPRSENDVLCLLFTQISKVFVILHSPHFMLPITYIIIETF